jgi:putative FmdB family regulatory protein
MPEQSFRISAVSRMVEKIMPVYEYTCPECRSVFEEWRKISETTENTLCPKCGAMARRIISNTAFVLKGGGWYVTDYGYRKGVSEEGQTTASDTAASSNSSAADGSGQNASPVPSTATPDPPPCVSAGQGQPASGTADGAST